jgi:hypothetical protein
MESDLVAGIEEHPIRFKSVGKSQRRPSPRGQAVSFL